jgi:hypothetical protein
MMVHPTFVLTMMMPHAPAPALQGLQEASERWVRRERARPRLTCGVAALDVLLGGGWPQGKVGELVGPASSGRSGVATATVAAATARGEVVAWLDLADALDPASAAAAGVDLARLLWVRPRGVGEAVRAVEMVLEVGGFTVLVLDLGAGARGVPGAETGLGGARRRGWGALRLRLARTVERAGAVALVLADRPWIGTLAGVTVVLEWGKVRWGACGKARWLSGISLRARVERGGVRHDPNVRAAGPPASSGWVGGCFASGNSLPASEGGLGGHEAAEGVWGAAGPPASVVGA